MTDEEKDKEQEQEQEEEEDEGLSEEERQAIISDFQARIEANEFEQKSFHGVVKSELYPLLGEGHLDPDEFGRLVRAWARKNHPKEWPMRSYQDD